MPDFLFITLTVFGVAKPRKLLVPIDLMIGDLYNQASSDVI